MRMRKLLMMATIYADTKESFILLVQSVLDAAVAP